jgi:hypothetical protein
MFGGFPAALIEGLSSKIFLLLEELEAQIQGEFGSPSPNGSLVYQFWAAEQSILLDLEREAREAEMLLGA